MSLVAPAATGILDPRTGKPVGADDSYFVGLNDELADKGFIVTATDVIHSFGVPAMWQKVDANPGQLVETWVKVDRPGVYFGQCSELCGARHGYMPIAVEVVPEATFNAWVASKGGTPKGAKPSTEATGATA